MNPKAVPLIIFLIKKHFRSDGEVLQLPQNIIRRVVEKNGSRLGMLYVRPPHQHPPSWMSFFAGVLDEAILTASASAILLVTAKERIFALTFGYGRTLLNPAAVEEQFGLKVTLNAVGSDKIRSMDWMRFDTSQHSRIQASKATPIGQFGLNIEQDLLCAVTGIPRDLSFGTQLTGRIALQTSVKITLGDVPSLLARFLAEYEKQDYKQQFPWVDQIHDVHDPQLLDVLEEELLRRIKAADFDRMWLAVPEIIDWSRIKGFRYRSARSATEYPDLHLNDFLCDVKALQTIGPDQLRRRYVHAISNETEQPFDRWSVYRCLYAELEIGKEQFVLTNGRWYRAAREFITAVDGTIAQIPEPEIQLPANTELSEEAYNRRIAVGPVYALMDRKLITYPGGTDKIELCDVYTVHKQFIHIKKYAGSGPLSHLFAQGVVSGELFLQEPDFRLQANQQLPETHRWSNVESRPVPTEYTVIFGIISKSARPLRLPFFSRVTLRNAYRRLTALGYKVCLAKIPGQVPTQAGPEMADQPKPALSSIAGPENRPESLGA